MTPDEEAMVYVIEHLAPDPGRSLTGVLLFASRHISGVTVNLDWPTFLGKPPHEVEAAYRQRAGHDMPAWNLEGET